MIRQRTFIALVILVGLFTFTSTALAKNSVTFWTTESEKDRMETQRAIARDFTKKTGIEVQIVPVQENMLAEKVTAAFAAKSLPDVIFHPMEYTIGWLEAGVLDGAAATQVIDDLGKDTFGAGPLNLARAGQGYAAVPADGWGQLLLYRKDLFEKQNLPAPDTWDKILKAAETLHNKPLIWGIEVATDPGQVFTQQVFEHVALSNGVRLVDKSGQVNLNTPQMVAALEFYKKLAAFTPPGNLHWLHTRMDYLSGRAAMVIWSPFILDELSGLRDDQPVIPDIKAKKRGTLAHETGFVTVIQGPDGQAQYGQISYLGITRDADKAAAQKWVAYLLSDGYLKWLSMAPEGKWPLRKGTAASPAAFIDGWKNLEFGKDIRAKISEYYGPETVKILLGGVDRFDRWGFAAGKGALVSKIYGTKVIPEILKRMLDGEISPAEAAKLMDERVKALDK